MVKMKSKPKSIREGRETLTRDIDCEWCGAKAGEPCKIQLTAEEMQIRKSLYKLGTEYLDGERIHLIRSKKL